MEAGSGIVINEYYQTCTQINKALFNLDFIVLNYTWFTQVMMLIMLSDSIDILQYFVLYSELQQSS